MKLQHSKKQDEDTTKDDKNLQLSDDGNNSDDKPIPVIL